MILVEGEADIEEEMILVVEVAEVEEEGGVVIEIMIVEAMEEAEVEDLEVAIEIFQTEIKEAIQREETLVTNQPGCLNHLVQAPLKLIQITIS